MSYSTFNSIAISGLASAVPTAKVVLRSGNIDNNSTSTSIRRSSAFQTTADLGYTAAKFIIDKKQMPLEEIGVVIFVSKTPDYRGPATAAVLQGRLGLSTDCIAYDVNIGSAGFAYGTQIVCAHLDSINKNIGLLIVGDTATKQIADKDTESLSFGDGASAIIFEKRAGAKPILIGTMAYSDHYKSYTIEKGGFRQIQTNKVGEEGNERSVENNYLQINRTEFLEFVNTKVPKEINKFLKHFNLHKKEYDLFAFHQFGRETINTLSKIMKRSFKELPINFDTYGNTCGNSIPLLLSDKYGKVKTTEKHILGCGYGEGYSIGIIDISMQCDNIFGIIESDEYYEEGFITHKK